MDSKYLNTREAAKLTGFPQFKIERLCRAGRLSVIKPGGRNYLIERDSLEKYLSEINDVSENTLTCAEVAGILGVDIKTVWIWCRKKKLKAVRLGNNFRISRKDLDDFIKGAGQT